MDEVALLEGLLRTYSPTGAEQAAVAYLTEAMRGLGFEAGVDEIGNAIGRRGEGERQIVLLGHIDTVAGEIAVRREGDLLYGRGAVDAKGPLACFVAAASQTAVPPGWQVVVIGAVGEEGDSRGARWILDRYRPQYAIIGEPSGWERVTLGYKGSALVKYRVEQALAHPAAQQENAPQSAVTFWNRLMAAADEWNAPHERAFDQVTPILRRMQSGEDGFHGWAELWINLRLPLWLPPAEALRRLGELGGEARLELLDEAPAYLAEKNTALVRGLLAAIRAAGGKPAFALKSGTADMNLVAPVWGCPAVAYGPGDSNLDHTPHEHISLAEYRRSIEVLSRALGLWMQP
uniref:Putative [LysW]-lysine hydrolase n=1 Tax=Bellilinea caldifistulae TaxID=360411 RepID=A0A7C4L006_9CHLR